MVSRRKSSRYPRAMREKHHADLRLTLRAMRPYSKIKPGRVSNTRRRRAPEGRRILGRARRVRENWRSMMGRASDSISRASDAMRDFAAAAAMASAEAGRLHASLVPHMSLEEFERQLSRSRMNREQFEREYYCQPYPNRRPS